MRPTSSQSWYRVRNDKCENAQRTKRQANRRNESIAARRSLFDEHDQSEDAHPCQMCDTCRKHDEHERPAAAETVGSVAEAKAQSVERSAAVVSREIDAGIAARL